MFSNNNVNKIETIVAMKLEKSSIRKRGQQFNPLYTKEYNKMKFRDHVKLNKSGDTMSKL